MDLLERIYKEEIESNPYATNSGFATDIDSDVYYDTKQKLTNSFKTKKQKELFRNFELCLQDRLKYFKKEMFLTGLSKGLKMGIEADKRIKNLDIEAHSRPKLPDGYRFDE